MPLYDFGQPGREPDGMRPGDLQQAPPEPPAMRQSSHAEHGRLQLSSPIGDLPTDVEEFLLPGFKSLDGAMKKYWSGIRVPTKDGYRFMRVKVAGGDKSLLVWRDELVGGRARLPVAAIDRSGHDFNPQKYSPPSLAMAVKYPTKRGDLALLVYRPVPFLVSYKLVVWAERKRDADYILYQALTRFNGGLADFRMFDGKLQGTVVLKYDGSTDSSDKETGYDQHANVRYELSMVAEAWLPLPERVVPTVLGRVQVLQERLGSILTASIGTSGMFEPVSQ